MKGWVLGGRSNMSGPVSREWEEPISARENDVSAHGDEAMSPPGGGMWAKRHVLRQESYLADKVLVCHNRIYDRSWKWIPSFKRRPRAESAVDRQHSGERCRVLERSFDERCCWVGWTGGRRLK